ncbi:hypothetical protein [Brevundimonas sp. PAMC22021]|uniref:hypothetical protein n=1 Tax=Brevundimonas sp. PAMC22021 TaxID=2861285 RepID=UPI001C62D383|nr:hypothetical protein [Brevundimonas sp. PAMC22021]QYF86219.1 hypothetical protein KY493_10235 [Brevundimonas sp. PAMC22021]
MTGIYLGETEDVLLNRKEASTELLRMGIRRSPATLAKIFCTRSDGPPCVHLGRTPYYPRQRLHDWARGQLTGLRSSSSQPRRSGDWTVSSALDDAQP